MDRIKAISDLMTLIFQGIQAGIPIFGMLKTGFEAIKQALQARGYDQDTEALDIAAAEDDVIIARARAEQEATE